MGIGGQFAVEISLHDVVVVRVDLPRQDLPLVDNIGELLVARDLNVRRCGPLGRVGSDLRPEDHPRVGRAATRHR